MFIDKVRKLEISSSRLFCCFIFINLISAEVRITNLVCKSLDEPFVLFDYCFLKSVNRTYRYASLKTKFLKIPITNVSLNIAFLKRANGYKPFLYNMTFDACKFLRSKKPNPVVQFFYDIFREYSNINHTCPFDHDLVVEKLNTRYLNNHFTSVLPFPKGDYLFESHWYAYNINRAKVCVYWTLD